MMICIENTVAGCGVGVLRKPVWQLQEKKGFILAVSLQPRQNVIIIRQLRNWCAETNG